MKRHWVYAVKILATKKIKIGTTNLHPNEQLEQIKNISPEPVTLLAAKPFDNGIDATNAFMVYCAEFAPYLAKGNGGWFEYGQPEINEIFVRDNWLQGENIYKSNKIEAVPIKVQKPTYNKIKAYSNITGKSAAKVIEEALNDWLDTVAESRIESIMEKSQGVIN